MARLVAPVPTGRPPALQSIVLNDFTGGLNLRDDAYQTRDNELSDCLDVDISAQGGVDRRKTVRYASGALGSGNPRLFAQRVGQVVYGNDDGTTDGLYYLTDFSGASTATRAAFSAGKVLSPWSSCVVQSVTGAGSFTLATSFLMVQRNAEQACAIFNGTTIANLTDSHGAYNDNLAAPTGNKAPIALICCHHLDFVFHAGIAEAGTQKANRIRWSHPGQPGDYRTNDFIDVGTDDDKIVALASFDGALYIFKVKSSWVLTGFDANTFALRKFADVGTMGIHDVAVSAYGLAFFDRTEGVHLIDPPSNTTAAPVAVPIFQKIMPAVLTDGTSLYDSNTNSLVRMGWLGRKLYVSVPWAGATVPSRTFIFDPFVGKGGAWTAYGRGFFGFVEHRLFALATTRLCIAASNPTRVHKIDAGTTTDNVDGTNEVTFDAYFFTSWLDAGDAALKKRWRRFSMTFDALASADAMFVRVWKNWTYRTSARFFTLQGNTSSSGLVWGSGNWGANWQSSAPTNDQQTVRGGTIGSAYAISAKVTGPTNKHWQCNALTFRLIPQRIV